MYTKTKDTRKKSVDWATEKTNERTSRFGKMLCHIRDEFKNKPNEEHDNDMPVSTDRLTENFFTYKKQDKGSQEVTVIFGVFILFSAGYFIASYFLNAGSMW